MPACRRFIELFTANIRNRNTRGADAHGETVLRLDRQTPPGASGDRGDYGTELPSGPVLRWATGRLAWNYIEPGKPVQNAFIESFNSRMRDECLNEHVFLSLKEARATIEAWRYDYNHLRPHGSLGALTSKRIRGA